MDAVVRGRRTLLITAVALAIVAAAVQACGAASGGALAGVSDRAPGGATPRGTHDGGPVDGTPAIPADYKTKFTKVNAARFVSTGHAAGRWDVDVWANEHAVKALASRSRDVPVGAVVVQEHFEKSGAGGNGPVMVMEKRVKGYAPDHGDWRYTVVAANGQLVKDGPVESCAGCHDDAPMDGLFPIVP